MDFQFFFQDLFGRVLQASRGWVLLLRLQEGLQLRQRTLRMRKNDAATTDKRLRIIGARLILKSPFYGP